MSVSLDDVLVVGISSRALFNLDDENIIYEKEGLKAYSDYQVEHENDILEMGSGFSLVKALCKLNEIAKRRIVEVIIMSRNSADNSLRIFNSIEHYGLDIKRAALSGGQSLSAYLSAFRVDLFLSVNEEDVDDAIQYGFAAGLIYPHLGKDYNSGEELYPIRIAFDGDAVLFSDESEQIYQKEGLDAFVANEALNAKTALPKGPFAKFIKMISDLQNEFDQDDVPIRTALVTARNIPAHERLIRTLRSWNVRVDETFFLGGVAKKDILEAFKAHIFFDDQVVHAKTASLVVPSAKVPLKKGKTSDEI